MYTAVELASSIYADSVQQRWLPFIPGPAASGVQSPTVPTSAAGEGEEGGVCRAGVDHTAGLGRCWSGCCRMGASELPTVSVTRVQRVSWFLQALALCRYLEGVGAGLLRGQRVIELGAGTGLVGLVAHALGECVWV